MARVGNERGGLGCGKRFWRGFLYKSELWPFFAEGGRKCLRGGMRGVLEVDRGLVVFAVLARGIRILGIIYSGIAFRGSEDTRGDTRYLCQQSR